MTNEALIYDLAKVLIAAAWADGEIDNDEINALKDLLFQLKDMTAHDWAQIEIYIDSPVGERERERLIQNLAADIKTDEDRAFVINTLEQLVEADGEVTESEKAAIAEVTEALQGGASGALRSLGGLLRKPIDRRSEALADVPNREERLDDFINNKIYYEVGLRLQKGDLEMEIDDREARRLSLAGGLLARVANVDDQITEEEFAFIQEALQQHWGLDPKAAALVTQIAASEIAKGMDYFRLTREFFELTRPEERESFVYTLFQIALADGDLSFDETEEIRKIANGLKLTHKQFIDAKLRAQGKD